MDDAISRAAAIDALADYIHNVDKVIGTGHLTPYDCKDAATSVLEELPSVQPARKKGKWIKDEEKSADHVEPIFICSSCHNYEAWGLTECTRYCPNCGARMEEK